MNSVSSLVARAKASVLVCEATLKAVETAVGQARSDLEKVKTALDMANNLASDEVKSVTAPGQRNSITAATASLQGSLSISDMWRPDTPVTFSPRSPCQTRWEEWESLWDEGKTPATGSEEPREKVFPWTRDTSILLHATSRSESLLTEKARADSRETAGSVTLPSVLGEDEDVDEDLMAMSSWATMARGAAQSRPKFSSCPQCPRCLQPRSQCRDGEPLLTVTKDTIGRSIKATGPTWPPLQLGREATVVGGKVRRNILLRWRDSHSVESYTVTSKDVPKFSFICPGLQTASKTFSSSEAEAGLLLASCLVRLPIKPFLCEVWAHDDLGEKHRLMVSADRDINLVALGLMVATAIPKIVVSVCQTGHTRNSIYSQSFSQVPSHFKDTTVLKFQRKVRLAADKPYLLVLHIFGGSSRVGYGGETIIRSSNGGREQVGLSFCAIDDVGKKTTNVQRGLVEKFYVEK